MRTNRLLTIFLVVFVDLLGFSLILPLLPYYAAEYGADAITIGLLTASYAAAQFVGAPLLGRWSDQYGRRPLLLVSIAGTVLGFVLLAVADPLGRGLAALFFLTANTAVLVVLFASRILAGLTGGNISVAQAYIADISTPENRNRALGMVGAAFGLGFIIGPAVGGLLSVRFGYAAPAWAAAGLATLNWVAVFLWLPESISPERRAEMTKRPRASFSLRAFAAAVRRPRLGPLFHIRFFFGLAFAMFQSIFALYAAGAPLNLSVLQTSFVLAYVGLLSVVVQGFALGKLSKRYSDRQLIFGASIAMAAGFALWGAAPSLWVLLIVLLPISFGGGVLNTVINSALSKSVYPEEIGGTLGLASSIESLTRVIAPVVGGALLQWARPWGPAIVTAVLMVYVANFVWRRLFVNPDPPLEPRSMAGGLSMPAS